MKKETFLLLIIAVLFLGCKSNYMVSKSSRITYEDEPGYTNKNVKYYNNDSLHLKCELEYNNLSKDTVTPFVFEKIQHYILNKVKVNKKHDIVLYSDWDMMIVLRKSLPQINEYMAFGVFDTAIFLVTPQNTLKEFYRKTHSISNKKLYFIEDVLQTKHGVLSFISFGQNESKGGHWMIDPTDPDHVLGFSEIYKHALAVTKRNAVRIIEQEAAARADL